MAQATLPRALRAALGDSCRCAQQACHNAAGLWAAAQMPARLRKEADAVVRTLRMAEASARSAAALATLLQPQLGAAPEAPRDQQRQQQDGGAARKGAKKKGPTDASGARRGKPPAPAAPAPSSARAAAGHACPPSGAVPPRKPRRRGRRRAKKALQLRAGEEDVDEEMPPTLSLTAPPFVPGAMELDDAWADSARRSSPEGALEALRPQRKLQRVRTSSRSPRGSDDDLTEEPFDAGMAAAATAAAASSADALLTALAPIAPPPGWLAGRGEAPGLPTVREAGDET